jgi:hypothetical protein
MKSAANAGVRGAIVRILLAAALTVAGMGGVLAQPSASIQAQPIRLNGWRAIDGPNDLHVYVCDRPSCAPNSRVSFLLYPGLAIAPGQLRRQREMVAELLQERSVPCIFVGRILRLGAPMRMHCVATASDGTKSFDTIDIISGINGSNLSASLISSSSDATASEANYERFETALKAVVNSDSRARP